MSQTNLNFDAQFEAAAQRLLEKRRRALAVREALASGEAAELAVAIEEICKEKNKA